MSENYNMNMSYHLPELKVLLWGIASGTVLQYMTPENLTYVLDIIVHLAQIACYVIGALAGIKTLKKVKDNLKKK